MMQHGQAALRAGARRRWSACPRCWRTSACPRAGRSSRWTARQVQQRWTGAGRGRPRAGPLERHRGEAAHHGRRPGRGRLRPGRRSWPRRRPATWRCTVTRDDFALLVLRLAGLGLAIFHGWPKLRPARRHQPLREGVASWASRCPWRSPGRPPSARRGRAAGRLGLFTRVAAALCAFTMVVAAFVRHHAPRSARAASAARPLRGTLRPGATPSWRSCTWPCSWPWSWPGPVARSVTASAAGR